MKKPFIVFKPHSISSTISNSSSTMFVFKKFKTKKLLESLIKSIYPNYLDEYYELQCVSDLDNEDFKLYLMCDEIEFDTQYFYIELCRKTNISPFDLYANWEEYCNAISNVKWNTLNAFSLKFSTKGLETIKPKFSDVYILISLYHNHKCKMEEELKLIGTYYSTF